MQVLQNKRPAQQSPLEAYAEQLQNLSTMLDSVMQHVDSILNGSTPPKPELAQMLLQTLGAISLPSQTADKEKFEEEFEAHLAVRVYTKPPIYCESRTSSSLVLFFTSKQDILMLSYLSNLAKYQMELSSRLALIPDRGMQQA